MSEVTQAQHAEATPSANEHTSPTTVHVGPAVDLPEMPATSVLPVTTELAETTRAKGDMLDSMKWLKRLPIDGVALRVGSVVAGLSYGTFFLREGFEGHIALTAATLTAAEGAKQISKVRQRHKFGKQVEATQEMQHETGLPIEIFRTKRNKLLDMRMYVSDDPVTTAQLAKELQLLEDAAEAGKVDRVTLPLSRVVDFVDQETLEGAQRQSRWLKTIKGSQQIADRKTQAVESFLSDDEHGEADSYDDQFLLTLSPTELHDLREQVQVASHNEPLDTIMRLLSRVQPNHPALKDYELLQTHPNATRDHLKRTLTMAIERRLDDVFAERREYPAQTTILNADGTSETADIKIPLKAKGYLSGTPMVGRDGQALVAWRSVNSSLLLHSTGLLDDKKITEAQLIELLKAADHLPKEQVAELCELGAWLSLEGLLKTDFEQDMVAQVGWHNNLEAESAGMPGLQERTAHLLYGRRSQRRAADILLTPERRGTRAVRTLGIVGLVGGLSMYTGSTLMQMLVDASDEANHNLQKSGIEFPTEPQIEARFGRDSPWLAAWSDLVDKENEYWYEPIGKFSRQLGINPYQIPVDGLSVSTNANGNMSPIFGDQKESNVGNVPTGGENMPAWWITSLNGQTSEGYWAQSGFDYLNSDDLVWLDNSTELKDNVQVFNLRQPDELDMTKPMLKVTAPNVTWNVTVDSEQLLKSPPKENEQGYYSLVSTPVLSGMRIVAAEVSDKHAVIKLLVDANGQQQLAIKSDERLEDLSFWLVKDKTAPLIHQTKPFFAEDPIDPKELDKSWKTYLGRPLPKDPEKTLETEEQAIAHRFRYALTPINRVGAMQNALRFVDTVFANERANCNVANTLLAISNPKLIMPVAGYLNSNTDEQKQNNQFYLSSRESHLWTVDSAGEIHDATPGGGNTGDFFKEDFDNQKPHEDVMQKRLMQTLSYLKYGAGLLIAEELIRRRKRIAKGAGRLYGKGLITAIDDEGLVAAQAAYNRAVYGDDEGKRVLTDPSGLIAPMRDEYRRPQKASKHAVAEAKERLSEIALTSSLKRLPKPTKTMSKTLRRDVRRARRIVRAMRRTQQNS